MTRRHAFACLVRKTMTPTASRGPSPGVGDTGHHVPVCLGLMLALLQASPASASTGAQDTPATPRETPMVLRMLNWPDYVSPSVLEAFLNTSGIRVEIVPFESDERKDELLLSTNGGEGLDLVLGQGHSMKRLVERGWMLPLDDSRLPQRKNTMPEYDSPDNGVHEHAIPYLWGTVGIAWRSDKLATPPPSWKAFFDPDSSLKGRLLVFNDSREGFGMALKASGHSANATDEAALQDARSLLLTQRPSVAKYGYPVLGETSELITGDIWMANVYSGDARYLMGLDPRIRFYIPKEGTVACVDYVGITRNSKHPEEAHKFLDFLMRPDIAAQNARDLNFATTNAAALSRLPKEFLNDPIVYPAENAGADVERYRILSPGDQKRRAELFINVIE
jgi:spermidine/putrescine transport system substrate-binding protein